MKDQIRVEWEAGDKFEIEIHSGSHVERFIGDTEQELIENLASAKASSSGTIKNLTQECKMLRGIIARTYTNSPLSPGQQSVVAEILETFKRIAGLRARQSQ